MATNLGTAYVSVMPSMQGFGSAVEAGLSGVDTSSAGTKMGERAGSGFAGGLAKGGAIMGAASAVMSRALDAVSASTGKAVARVDTMANFPKIMANLGIAAEEAQAAINTISEGLNGLPTTLDAGARAVQRLTSYNGDVQKSAQMFLALNDAIMAGGTDAGMQASALEQLTQAYTKGKMDMMEWRTIQQTMPAQLKQVADAMGMSVNTLGAGLRGAKKDADYLRDISMDELIGEIMRLDKEGSAGFASFEEQARTATTGIDTALANLNTRISRGVAELINAVGQENISGAINTISTGIVGIGTNLGQDLKVATAYVKEHEEELRTLSNTLVEFAPVAIRAWGAIQAFRGAKAVVSGLAGSVAGVAGKISSAGDRITAVGSKFVKAGDAGSNGIQKIGKALSSVSPKVVGLAGVGVAAAALVVSGIAKVVEHQQKVVKATEGIESVGKRAKSAAEIAALGTDRVAESTEKAAYTVGQFRDAALKAIDTGAALADSLNAKLDGAEENAVLAEIYARKIRELAGACEGSPEKIGELNAYVDKFNELTGAGISVVDPFTGAINLNADAFDNLTRAYKENVMAQAYGEVLRDAAKAEAEYQVELDKCNSAIETATARNDELRRTYGDLVFELDEYGNATNEHSEEYLRNIDVIAEAEKASKSLEEQIASSAKTREVATKKMFEAEEAEKVEREALEQSKVTVEQLSEAMESSGESLELLAGSLDTDAETIVKSMNDAGVSVEDFSRLGAEGFSQFYDSADANLTNVHLALDALDRFNIDPKTFTVGDDGTIQLENGMVIDLDARTINGKTFTVNDDGTIVTEEGAIEGLTAKINNVPVEWTTNFYANDFLSNVANAVRAKIAEVKNAMAGGGGDAVGDASGGVYKLHAAGGFITNGPTLLGRDVDGAYHIAGEAGRELVVEHANGTTSITPIENGHYMKPFAKAIASEMGGSSNVTNIYIEGVQALPDSRIYDVSYELATTILDQRRA